MFWSICCRPTLDGTNGCVVPLILTALIWGIGHRSKPATGLIGQSDNTF